MDRGYGILTKSTDENWKRLLNDWMSPPSDWPPLTESERAKLKTLEAAQTDARRRESKDAAR